MRQAPGWILRLPRQRRARKRVGELYGLVLAHHRTDRADPDLIDDLLELHRTDPQFFPETDMPIAVTGPFFAGIDSSPGSILRPAPLPSCSTFCLSILSCSSA